MSTKNDLPPTFAAEQERVKKLLDRFLASLREHEAMTCENCKQYERDREDRGVRA